MNPNPPPDEADEAYWTDTGLRALFGSLPGEAAETITADINDLGRLHRIVRERPCVTALEFGIGFSTIVLAHAMEMNERDHGAVMREKASRNSQLFQVFSVDTNERWIKHTLDRLPPALAARVHASHSPATATTFGGRLCHTYDRLPDVIPDFIYLDGPDPNEVVGSVAGLTFSIPERTAISADILLMEPTLLPGTIIAVDGREANVRFLTRNLQRPVSVTRDRDVSLIELVEPRLGTVDVIGVDVVGRPSERSA
jgi:hypothetical protein